MKLMTSGRDLLRRNRQIALVLAILVVDDDDHLAVADGLDRVLDGRERRTRPSSSLGHDYDPFMVVPARRRSHARADTYLPSMSHSRLTDVADAGVLQVRVLPRVRE